MSRVVNRAALKGVKPGHGKPGFDHLPRWGFRGVEAVANPVTSVLAVRQSRSLWGVGIRPACRVIFACYLSHMVWVAGAVRMLRLDTGGELLEGSPDGGRRYR